MCVWQPLHTPVRGRFAYVPVLSNASFYSYVFNSYGLLRAPWNSDDSTFISRHDHSFGFINDKQPARCSVYQETVRETRW
ncbi:unnamed protein product [Sphacelaria rigidula]